MEKGPELLVLAGNAASGDLDLRCGVDALELNLPKSILQFLDILLLTSAGAALVVANAFKVCTLLRDEAD